MRTLFGSLMAVTFGFPGCFRAASTLPPPPPPLAAPTLAEPLVGQTAPEITGEDLDGVSFQLSDYRGKVVLLDFWGDW
jgi:hypothetical protein